MVRRLIIALALASLVVPLAAQAGGDIEIQVPPDMTVEAQSPAGAVATFTARAFQNGEEIPVTCTPASGSTFGIRRTTVRCEASSRGEHADRSFHITVEDTTGPTVTVPADMLVETTESSAIVTFAASASDRVDGSRPVTCTPASGTRFSRGTTPVRCRSTDTRGNTGTASFNVTVAAPKPVITVPVDMTVEAQTSSGATVTYTASARTSEGVAIPVSCSPPSGSVFPLARTTVTCRATDPNNGETASKQFKLTVLDRTPPAITVPAGRRVRAAGRVSVVRFNTTAVDLVDGPVATTCAPPSGSRFRVGTTHVICTARDVRGNVDSATFDVTVVVGRATRQGSRFSPAAGARLLAPPLLAWPKMPKASYYNVQVFRHGHKILTAWPTRPRLRLHRSWRFAGRTIQLKRGTYTWFVWPAYERRGRVRYGGLLGSSTFTYAPRSA